MCWLRLMFLDMPAHGKKFHYAQMSNVHQNYIRSFGGQNRFLLKSLKMICKISQVQFD
jgi:hypothetical protein